MDNIELQREDIVKKGVLQRYSTREKKWSDKFYVLYQASQRNAARLDWYDNETSFLTNSAIRKSLFVEEIKKVEQVTPDDAEIREKCGNVVTNVLVIRKHRSGEDVVLLRAKKATTVKEWMTDINRLLESARTQSLRSRTTIADTTPLSNLYQPHAMSRAVSYDVEVDDTAAANMCNLFGQYRLVLTNEHVTLVDESDSPVLSWDYIHIRRYGYSGQEFTLEGGHRAGPAAGLFIFKSCRGADIRNDIENRMTAIRNTKQSTNNQDYTYVGFFDTPALGRPKSSDSTNSSAYTSPAAVPTENKTPFVGNPERNDSLPTKKAPPPPTAPKHITPITNHMDAPDGPAPSQSGPPKMSDVIGQLRRAPPSTTTSAGDGEYSSIDLVRTAGARAQPSGDDGTQQAQHVYGSLLMQTQRSQEPDATYAEIGNH